MRESTISFWFVPLCVCLFWPTRAVWYSGARRFGHLETLRGGYWDLKNLSGSLEVVFLKSSQFRLFVGAKSPPLPPSAAERREPQES